MKFLTATVLAVGFLSAAIYGDDMAGIPDSEKTFLDAEAAKMRAAGLDAKPLYNKVREGLAKGVSSAALHKAVTRERELYVEAARHLAPLSAADSTTKNTLAQSIVIATKRGAKAADIESAVKLNRDGGMKLMSLIDLLGDLARSGISGEKAVRAAMENAGRKAAAPSASVYENRADNNRAIQQREVRQDLPVLKPAPPPMHPPTGTQGMQDKLR